MKLYQKNLPSKSRKTLWFNIECKMAIRQRQATCRYFDKEPSIGNLKSFHVLKAKVRKTIKLIKKISWQNYVNQLNFSTISSSLEKSSEIFLEK